MSQPHIAIWQRKQISVVTLTPLQVEHARWTARYRLTEQVSRSGGCDLRRTLLNANLLDALDAWQTRHPYVPPTPVTLPQPSSNRVDSTSPPPVIARDFAAVNNKSTTTTSTNATATARLPVAHVERVSASDDDSLNLFYDSDQDMDADDYDADDVIPASDILASSPDSLTSCSSESEASESDSDEWDSEYPSTDLPLDDEPQHLEIELVEELETSFSSFETEPTKKSPTGWISSTPLSRRMTTIAVCEVEE